MQCKVVCRVQHREYLSLFWILSRIGQSDVVRYGANYYRDFYSKFLLRLAGFCGLMLSNKRLFC
jgi:hypothetical protein